MMEYINKQILLNDLHNAGGCDAEDEYSKGWDAAIDEAIRLLEAQQVYEYHVCIEKLICKLHNQAAEIKRLLAENAGLKEQVKKLIAGFNDFNKNICEACEHIDSVDKARAEGQNEAWELARKILFEEKQGGMEDEKYKAIFGSGTPSAYVIKDHTYPEAAAKVEAWEKAREEIKVGDVVRVENIHRTYGVVTCVDGCKITLMLNSGVAVYRNENACYKTGRHIDIDSFLKQIGGEE